MIWKIYSKKNFSLNFTREKNLHSQYKQECPFFGLSLSLARIDTHTHTHTHDHTHTRSHANSCLRIFAQGVSPPKIPCPSLSAHLHPSYPSKLCISCILSQRIIKLLPLYCLDFLFFLLQVLRFLWAPPDFSSKDGQQLQQITPQGPCPCPLLMKLSDLGEVPGHAPGQSPPGLQLTWFKLPRRAVLPYFWILL